MLTERGMYDGNMGLSQPFATPPWIQVPWYTCRIKGTFFDTVAHECGHISAIHAKTDKGQVWFNSTTRNAIRKWMLMLKNDTTRNDENSEMTKIYTEKW